MDSGSDSGLDVIEQRTSTIAMADLSCSSPNNEESTLYGFAPVFKVPRMRPSSPTCTSSSAHSPDSSTTTVTNGTPWAAADNETKHCEELARLQSVLKALLRRGSNENDDEATKSLESCTVDTVKSLVAFTSEKQTKELAQSSSDEATHQSNASCRLSPLLISNKSVRKSKTAPLHISYPCKSRDGTVELVILSQPEEQHRARYMTEGSRGAVKDRSGAGFPMVKLTGYNQPATLQVFIGSDQGRPTPHLFYQASKACGKTSPPCRQRKIQGTVVIEMELLPEKDMTVCCDSVGILKERNVDVEHRLQYFGAPHKVSKKRSPRCRLIFRVQIDREETLQVASAPILCTQPPGIPEISRQSHTECSAKGNVDLFLIGKNFLKDTKVIFRQMPLSVNDVAKQKPKPIWEEVVIPEKDYLQPTHLICTVPAYKDYSSLLLPLKIEVIVQSSGKRSEPQQFTFLPTQQLHSLNSLGKNSLQSATPTGNGNLQAVIQIPSPGGNQVVQMDTRQPLQNSILVVLSSQTPLTNVTSTAATMRSSLMSPTTLTSSTASTQEMKVIPVTENMVQLLVLPTNDQNSMQESTNQLVNSVTSPKISASCSKIKTEPQTLKELLIRRDSIEPEPDQSFYEPNRTDQPFMMMMKDDRNPGSHIASLSPPCLDFECKSSMVTLGMAFENNFSHSCFPGLKKGREEPMNIDQPSQIINSELPCPDLGSPNDLPPLEKFTVSQTCTFQDQIKQNMTNRDLDLKNMSFGSPECLSLDPNCQNLKEEMSMEQNEANLCSNNQSSIEYQSNNALNQEHRIMEQFLEREINSQNLLQQEINFQSQNNGSLNQAQQDRQIMDRFIEREINNQTLLQQELNSQTMIQQELNNRSLLQQELNNQSLLQQELNNQTLLQQEIASNNVTLQEMNNHKLFEQAANQQQIIQHEINNQRILQEMMQQEIANHPFLTNTTQNTPKETNHTLLFQPNQSGVMSPPISDSFSSTISSPLNSSSAMEGIVTTSTPLSNSSSSYIQCQMSNVPMVIQTFQDIGETNNEKTPGYNSSPPVRPCSNNIRMQTESQIKEDQRLKEAGGSTQTMEQMNSMLNMIPDLELIKMLNSNPFRKV